MDMGSYAFLGVVVVALIQTAAMAIEMFRWPWMAKRIFPGTDPEFIEATAPLAANQGLYNGFLAAGLIWSLVVGLGDPDKVVATFFLGCVAVAGLYGAKTVTRATLIVQTLFAAIALVLVWWPGA
jgi:putative membrane protein